MFIAKPIRWAVVFVVLALSWTLAAGTASAATLTWTGSAAATWDITTNNWSTWGGVSGGPYDSTNGAGTIADFVNGGDTPVVSGGIYSNGIQFDNTANITGGTINLAGTTPTVTVNASSGTIGSGLAGTAGLNMAGTGTIYLTNGANSFTGGVSFGSGRLNFVSGALGTNTVTCNGGTLQWATGNAQDISARINSGIASAGQFAYLDTNGNNVAFGTAIGGSGGLYKLGAGSLSLNVANSYTGGTTVSGGTLNLTTGASTGVIRGPLTINSGATVNANTNWSFGYGGTSVSTSSITINGGVIVFNGTADAGGTDASSITMTGGTISGVHYDWYNGITNTPSLTTNASNTTAVVSSGFRLRLATTNQATFNIAQGTTPNGIDLLVSGPITTNATNGIVKSGAGLMDLTGTSTYTGGTNISAGTLMVGGGGVLGSAGNYAGAISNSAALAMNTSSNQTFSGVISGSGSLTQMGPGTLLLTASNTYTGPTNVNAGNLYVNGSLAAGSSVSVAGNATLGGTGSVGGIATIAPGGIVEAGRNGTGQLTLAGLAFGGSGKINFGTLANYATIDGINVTGASALTTTGSNSITIAVASVAGAVVNTPYKLIDYNTSIGGSGIGAFQLGTLPNRAAGVLSVTGSEIDLTLTVATDYLKWTGTGNLAAGWDTAAANWKLNSTGATTAYINNPGDTVVFDDSAPAGNTTVNLNTLAVHPTSVTFNNSSNNYTLQGAYGIVGATSLIKSGTGTLLISNSNGFTGGVTINNGTVQTNNAAALGANSVTFGPGTTSGILQLGGVSTSIGGLTTNAVTPGTAVVQNANANPATLTLNTAGTQTYAGVIQNGPGGGAFGMTMAGAGTQVLTGSLAYSGPTLVAAGELDTSYPPASALITVNSGATLGLKSAMTVSVPATINGPGTATDVGALRNDVGTGNTTSYNGTITLAGNATIRNQSGTLNLGAINGTGGTAALTLIGVGSTNPIYLNGAITSAGTTMIKGTGNTNATLAAVYLGAANALPNTPLTINDTNLWLNGFDQQVGSTYGMNTFGIYNGSASSYTPTFTVNMGAACDLGYLASGHAGNDARFNLAVASTGTGSTYYNMHMWGSNNVYTGNTTVFNNAYLQMGQAGQSWDTPPASFAANCLTLNGGGILNQNGNNNGFVNDVVGATQGITLATGGGYIGAGGSPNTLTINSVISGSGALNVTTNLGTLVLAASNTYSGDTVIGATGPGYSAAATVANVQLGVANALPNGPGMGNLSLPLAGSSLDLNGFATSVNGLSGFGVVTNSNNSTTATFSVGANDAVATFAGTIQNNIALNKVGSGTLTLTGLLTYTGATTIAKGGVALGTGVSLPATAVTLGGGAATVNGAVLDLGGNNQSVAGLAVSSAAPASQIITNNSATTDSLLTFNGGSTPASFPGAITGGSNGHTIALSVSAGTLTLGGTNTYTGATTVNFGSLYVNGALNPAAAAPIAVYSTLGGKGRVGAVNINPGATLEAGQGGTGRLTVAGSLTFNSNATVNVANVVAGSIAQYSGSAAVVVNGPLTANASSGGVVDLSLGTGGVNSGTYHLISYRGGLQLNGAQFTDTFQVLQAPALIAGRQTGSLMNDAGSINYVVVGGSPVWSGLNGGTTPNNSWEVNPSLTNWNVTIGATTSPTDFRTTDSVTFDDTAGAGHTTVALNTANVSPVNVLFANQTLSYTLSGSHAITGATGVTKNNAGLVAIDNSNSFSGGMFVNGGTLQLNANNTFSGGATVSGGLLQINSANTFTGDVTISGGSVQLGDPGAMNASTPNAVTFGPNPASGAKLQLMGNSVTIGGLSTDPVNPGSPVVENGGAADAVLTVNNSTVYGGTTFAGVLQDGTGGGKLAFTKDGFYDVTLAGVNTYSGSTTIVNGTLHVGNNGAIPYGPGKGDITVSGGMLDLAGFAASVNGLWGNGTIDNSAGNGTLVAGNNNATSTFDGTIRNSAGVVTLNKTGNGALTLTGANYYSGPTIVNAGTLVLANAAALPSGAGTSGVTVNGGTLDVDGQAVTTSALFGSGTITSSTSGGVLTVSGTAASAFNGVIADGAAGATMGLAKNTFSVLTLGGSTANAYTGGTTLMNGVIKLQKSNGVAAIPGNILITGAPSWVGLPNQTSGIELYANEQTGGTATVVAFDDSNFTGQADFRLRGYTTTIGGLQYTGNTTRAIVANGAAFDAGDSGDGTVKIDVAAGQAYSFNGLIADTTAGGNDLNKLNLVMMGSGTQILGSLTSVTSSNNSFSGSLTVNGGTLVAAAVSNGANSALGAASNTRTITVNAGGTLEFAAPNVFGQFNSTAAPTLAIRGGTVTNADPASSGAINNALNNVTLNNGVLTATTGQDGGYAAWNVNGTITSSGNSLISTSDPVFGTVMLNGASGSSGTTTISVSNGTLTISAPLVQDTVDNIVDALSMAGSGTLVLSGTNTYTGGTTVNGGTLIVTNNVAIVDGTSLTVGNASAFAAPVVPTPAAAAAISPVPEPGTVALLVAAAVAGIGIWRRKERRA